MESTTITRRSLVGLLGASAATIAVPAVASQGHQMAYLIERHRTASKAYDAASAALEDAEMAFEADHQKNPIRERISVGGGCLDPYHDPLPDTIAERYRDERGLWCNQRAAALCPEATAIMSARLDELQAIDMAKAPQILRRFEERRERFDLPRIEREEATIGQAEHDTFEAVARYEPQTLKEYRLKVAYAEEMKSAGAPAYQIAKLFTNGGAHW